MKKLGIWTLCLLVPALGAAADRALYRIDLRNGATVVALDAPVQRGTVVTFRQSPSGRLTGLPAEEIVSIRTGASSSKLSVRPQAADAVVRGRMTAIQTLAQPMQPGDIVVLGPTGSGSAQLQGGANLANGQSPNGPYGANNGAMNVNPALYGGGTPPGTVPPGFGINGQPFVPAPGDTARAPSGNPPTIGPNGFPVTGATTVNTSPNGTPVVVQPGTPAGGQPTIGPNGTPVLAQPGSPGATPPTIGPNGTPVLAPPGAPGSSQPATAPNGTPATGQPGTPSSAQPATAPNGTPASPPPGGTSPK